VRLSPIVSFIVVLVVPLLAIATASPEIFMPGKVMKGHAEIEGQCMECHEPWKGPLTEKCTDCHSRTEPRVDPVSHGRECLSCHPEHKGRNVSISYFDHSRVDYKITEGHADLGCQDCHPKGYLRDPTPACEDCHQQNGKGFDLREHKTVFGGQCLDCHRGGKIDLKDFDHSKTGYVIDKHHYRLKCKDCHPKGFTREPSCNVSGCHSRGEMYGEHVEHGIYDYDVRSCLECHYTKKGKKWFKEDFD